MTPSMEDGNSKPGIAPPRADQRPLVSIITVVYNGAAFIEGAIQSVLAQDWPVEYIVLDGGSTDGTQDIIRRYEDRLAYWHSKPDKGIYDAMNQGIARCTGEWVGMINADDRYVPDAIPRMMATAQANPQANILHGDIWLCFPDGGRRIKKARPNGFLLKYWEMVLNHPSFFVRRSYYEGRPYDAGLRVSADHKWTYQAWREDPHQFVYVPHPIAEFAIGGASTRMPLTQVLREGARLSRSLGMGPWDTFVGQTVRTAMYPVQHLKLWINRLRAQRTL
jgi:glycosyltransferase involved in cell wall biosynthesis